jgi:CubicO group peptidase (beta-lactamase class C family)
LEPTTTARPIRAWDRPPSRGRRAIQSESTAYEPVTIVDLLRMASGVDWTENTND